MTKDEILKIKNLLKKNYSNEINISLLENNLNINFKEANYILDVLEAEGVLDRMGKIKIPASKIDSITMADPNDIKHLNVVDDALAIIKRDGKFDAHAVEMELNVRNNMMFDLLQELMARGVIERFENDYRLKK